MEPTDKNNEFPEPDLPSYEGKAIEELEEEIATLSQGHLQNVDEIGIRIYWLNKKYKAATRRKGTGVTAFLKRIGWVSKKDRNHWNYLVRKYTPAEEKQARAEERQAKRLWKQREQDESWSGALIEDSINKGFDEVKAVALESLINRPLPEQLALSEFILIVLDELEEKIKAWDQTPKQQQVA
jgi:hypothetical protein